MSGVGQRVEHVFHSGRQLSRQTRSPPVLLEASPPDTLSGAQKKNRTPHLLEEVEEAGAAHPHHERQQAGGGEGVLRGHPDVVQERKGRDEVLQLQNAEETEHAESRGVEADAGGPQDRLDVPEPNRAGA